MGVVTQGMDKLRAAEKQAREKKLRVWKDYTAPTVTMSVKEKNYTGKVRLHAPSVVEKEN